MCKDHEEMKKEIDELKGDFRDFKCATESSIMQFTSQLARIESGQTEMLKVFNSGKGVFTIFGFTAKLAAGATAIGGFWWMITHWGIK